MPCSKEFAEIADGARRADVEPALACNLEARPGRVGAPITACGFHPKFAGDDGHSLWRFRPEVKFSTVDDAQGLPATVAFEPDALHGIIEIRVVLRL